MNVLLLDDHPLVRSALESVVSSLGSEVTVHPASTGAQAQRFLKEHPHPDLVLLDLGLPDVDGMQLLAQWRREHPELRVVVVSAAVQPANVIRALDEGARGFIPKLTSNEVLLQALRMVLAGGIYVPPLALQSPRDATEEPSPAHAGEPSSHQTHERLRETALTRSGFAAADWTRPLQTGSGFGASPVAAGFPPAPSARLASIFEGVGAAAPGAPPASLPHLRLTVRQTEVLQGLLRGQPNKLIARQLNLSVETVKDHVAALLRVLGVSSRTQAVLAVSQMMARANTGSNAAHQVPAATRRAVPPDSACPPV